MFQILFYFPIYYSNYDFCENRKHWRFFFYFFYILSFMLTVENYSNTEGQTLSVLYIVLFFSFYLRN